MKNQKQKRPLNFVFIGRSGSGKGVQAKRLLKKFNNLVYISTGDLMRDLAGKNTDAGKRIKAILDKGGLPFDDMATTLWMHKIAYIVKENQGIICDGFPRRLNEAGDFDRFMKWLNREESTKVLLIDVSDGEALKRLLRRARYDDDEKKIKNRLSWFKKRVAPVIDYYREQGRLIHINGEQTRDKVFEEILKKTQ